MIAMSKLATTGGSILSAVESLFSACGSGFFSVLETFKHFFSDLMGKVVESALGSFVDDIKTYMPTDFTTMVSLVLSVYQILGPVTPEVRVMGFWFFLTALGYKLTDVATIFSKVMASVSPTPTQCGSSGEADFEQAVAHSLVASGQEFFSVLMVYALQALSVAHEAVDALGDKLSALCTIPAGLFSYVETFVKRLGAFGYAARGIAFLYENIGSFVVGLLDYLFPSRRRARAQVLESVTEGLGNWATRVLDMSHPSMSSVIRYNLEARNDALNLYKEGIMYRRIALSEDPPLKLLGVFNEFFKKAELLAQLAHEGSQEEEFRVDPFSIVLVGDTNIGKSRIIRDVCDAIMRDRGVHPLENYYTRATSDRFWSRYNNQYCVLFDDLGKEVPELAGYDSFTDFFCCKSCDSFRLNMADLSEKGKCFTSKLVGACTNFAYPSVRTLRVLTNQEQTEAANYSLWRRRNVLLRMTSSVNFQDAEVRVQGNSHLRFEFLDPVKQGRVISGPCTYEDMMFQVRERARRYLDKEEFFVSKRRLGLSFSESSAMWQAHLNELDRARLREGYAPAGVDVPSLEEQKRIDDLTERLAKPVVFSDYTTAFYDRSYDEGEGQMDPGASQLTEEVGASLVQYLNSDGTLMVDALPPDNSYIRVKFEFYKALLGEARLRAMSEAHARLSVSDTRTDDAVGRFVRQVREEVLAVQRSWTQRILRQITVPRLILLCYVAFVAFCGYLLYRSQGHLDRYLQEETAHVSEQREQAKRLFPKLVDNLDEATQLHKRLQENGFSVQPQHQAYGPVDKKPTSYVIKTAAFGEASPQMEEFQVEDVKTFRALKAFLRGRAQSSGDVNADEILVNRVVPNMYALELDGKFKAKVNALGVGGHLLLVNHHFFDQVEDGCVVYVTHLLKKFEVRFSRASIRQVRDYDACVWDVGVRIPPSKRIAHLFLDESELTRIRKTSAEIVNVRAKGEQVFVERKPIEMEAVCVEGHHRVSGVIYTGRETRYKLAHGWKYTAPTRAGDCGGVLVIRNPSSTRKLAGIHTAGNQRAGWGTLILASDLKEAMSHFEEQVQGLQFEYVQSQMELVLAKPVFEPQGSFSYFGTVKRGAHLPTKSDLIPSPINGVAGFIPTTGPSVLSDRDPRLRVTGSVLGRAVNRFGSLRSSFDPEAFRDVASWMRAEVLRIPTGVLKREVVSESVAINGLPGVQFCDRLSMNTSPGYPFTLTRGTRAGRLYLFDEVDGELQPRAELRAALDVRTFFLEQGEVSLSVWLDCLKSERRSLEKIEQGSSRSFSIAPLDYLIVCRRYFLAFSVAMMQDRLNNFCAVGINPLGSEWTDLYYRLARCGTRGFDADYKHFDANVMPELVALFTTCVQEWYGDGNELGRRVLMSEMTHTLTLAFDCLYMKHQGLPSGHPLTVLVNCFANAFFVRYAYRVSVPPALATASVFKKEIRCVTYGDDLLLVLSAFMNEHFTFVCFRDVMAGLGIVVTNGKKTDVTEHCDLDEMTFLKRSFVKHSRFDIRGGLQKQVLREMLMWLRVPCEPVEALEENIGGALREAYQWGKEFFDSFVNEVNTALHSVGLDPLGESYHEIGRVLAAENVQL